VSERHHKPVKMSPWRLEASESEEDALWRLHPECQRLIASDTASLLVRSDSADDAEVLNRLTDFVDSEGLDTLAELWSQSEAGSLPRALWRLFQIRERIIGSPQDIGRLVQLGLDSLDTIDPVVLAAEQPVTADSIRHIIDQILSGGFYGSLADALERASALARLVAEGFLHAEPESDGNHYVALSSLAWSDVASELALSAKRERNSNLR
jgi:hypothetical protein